MQAVAVGNGTLRRQHSTTMKVRQRLLANSSEAVGTAVSQEIPFS